jgi:hypothetical protein
MLELTARDVPNSTVRRRPRLGNDEVRAKGRTSRNRIVYDSCARLLATTYLLNIAFAGTYWHPDPVRVISSEHITSHTHARREAQFGGRNLAARTRKRH